MYDYFARFKQNIFAIDSHGLISNHNFFLCSLLGIYKQLNFFFFFFHRPRFALPLSFSKKKKKHSSLAVLQRFSRVKRKIESGYFLRFRNLTLNKQIIIFGSGWQFCLAQHYFFLSAKEQRTICVFIIEINWVALD